MTLQMSWRALLQCHIHAAEISRERVENLDPVIQPGGRLRYIRPGNLCIQVFDFPYHPRKLLH